MDSVPCRPCTPESGESNVVSCAHQFCSPSSIEPFTPPVTGIGPGPVHEFSNDASSHSLPFTETDLWDNMAQTLDSRLQSCVDNSRIWVPELQPVQSTSASLEPWLSMSSFQLPPSSLSLSPPLDAVQLLHTTMPSDVTNTFMMSPSLTHTTRSVTPSEIYSLNDYQPAGDFTHTPGTTPYPNSWYSSISENFEVNPNLHGHYGHIPQKSSQELMSTVSSPVPQTTKLSRTLETERTVEPRRRASLPQPLSTASTELDDKIRSVKEKIKLTRLRHQNQLPHSQRPLCPICRRSFSRKHNLQQHIERAHRTKTKDHKCDQCDKAFNRPADLQRHFQSVSIEEIFTECSILIKIDSFSY
jgi:hypothetical protein